MRGILKNRSFLIRIFSLLLIFVFFSLLGIFIAIPLAGDDFTNIISIRILQLVQSVFSFVLPPFILAYLLSDNTANYLQLNHSFTIKTALIVIAFMILSIPFINLISDWNQRISLPEFLSGIEEMLMAKEMETAELTERLLDVHTIKGLFFNIFLIAIIPALGEELFFRGTIQRIVQNWKGSTVAIWISAFIFSAVHFQFYGFIPRLLLGALFGYLLVWSRNLWIPIIAHFVNNFMIVVYYYLINNGFTIIDLNTWGSGNTWWIGIISGVIFISGILYLKKYFSNIPLPNN